MFALALAMSMSILFLTGYELARWGTGFDIPTPPAMPTTGATPVSFDSLTTYTTPTPEVPRRSRPLPIPTTVIGSIENKGCFLGNTELQPMRCLGYGAWVEKMENTGGYQK